MRTAGYVMIWCDLFVFNVFSVLHDSSSFTNWKLQEREEKRKDQFPFWELIWRNVRTESDYFKSHSQHFIVRMMPSVPNATVELALRIISSLPPATMAFFLKSTEPSFPTWFGQSILGIHEEIENSKAISINLEVPISWDGLVTVCASVFLYYQEIWFTNYSRVSVVGRFKEIATFAPEARWLFNLHWKYLLGASKKSNGHSPYFIFYFIKKLHTTSLELKAGRYIHKPCKAKSKWLFFENHF